MKHAKFRNRFLCMISSVHITVIQKFDSVRLLKKKIIKRRKKTHCKCFASREPVPETYHSKSVSQSSTRNISLWLHGCFHHAKLDRSCLHGPRQMILAVSVRAFAAGSQTGERTLSSRGRTFKTLAGLLISHCVFLVTEFSGTLLLSAR